VPHRGAASLGPVGLHVRGELVRLAEKAAAAAMLGSSALVVHDFVSRSITSVFSFMYAVDTPAQFLSLARDRRPSLRVGHHLVA